MRNRYWLGSLLTAGLAVLGAGCGDDSPVALEGDWESAASARDDKERVGNSAPEVVDIRFEPEEAFPGGRLRAKVESRDAEGDVLELGYAWRVNGKRVENADGAVFSVPDSLRRGDRIELTVVASDGRTNSPEFTNHVLVANQPPRLTGLEVRVVDDAKEGAGVWMAVPAAEDPDDDEVSYRYEWTIDGRPVDGAEQSLPRADRKRGEKIALRVWASDGDDESGPLDTAPFEVANSAPDIDSRPPAMDSSGRFVYVVSARDRDGDRGLLYSLVRGPKGMTLDPFSGEMRWAATVEDAGKHVVEVSVDDRKGGVTRQTFYLSVQVGSVPASQG